MENSMRFSGHETFPLRQLWLRKAYDQVANAPQHKTKQIFSDSDAIVRFGVGKNMVSSIKYWSLSTGVLEENEGRKGYKTTKVADILFGDLGGKDPYCEHPASPWYIHWTLASNGGYGNRSTTWSWLFNQFSSQSFDLKQLTEELKLFAEQHSIKVAQTTLRRDVECCVRSYAPKSGKGSIEEMSESLLGELGLIQQTARGTYEFKRGPKHSLPHEIFAIALLDFWKSYSPDTTTLSFSAIAHSEGSPGRVFKLDEDSIMEYLLSISDTTVGRYSWSDTAGMKQVIRVINEDYMAQRLSLLEEAYD